MAGYKMGCCFLAIYWDRLELQVRGATRLPCIPDEVIN